MRIDLFPHLFATLKASAYFSVTLDGFTDSHGRFKVFREDEAPTPAESPYITIELDDGDQDQRTNWIRPFATLNVWGKDTEWETLYAIAAEASDIFLSGTCLAASGDGDPVQYMLIGRPVYGQGRNPVTERVVRSVGLRFGIAE